MTKAMIQMHKIDSCAECDYMAFGEPEQMFDYFCNLAAKGLEENGQKDFSDKVPTWCPLPEWGQQLGVK